MKNVSHKLTEFFHAHLPLIRHMELEVEHYDGDTLVLCAPLGPNINDKLTAFGGSLYNVAVMTCWGMAYLKTQEHGIECNQVVTKANIIYMSPVRGALRAVCKAPPEAEIEAFIAKFKQRGKAKIDLSAKITCGGKLAVDFAGQYAILSE